MIAGYFVADGRPYVRCRLHLPRFQAVEEVDLLVDTGSDNTILHPRAGTRFHIPFEALSDPVDVTGAGGQHTYFAEPAIVSLYDGAARHDFRIDLYIGKPHPVTDGLDSLLGRDVLNELEMEYAPGRGRLRFDMGREEQ